MRIKEISVSGLFGIFDHVISLNMGERITIIHGPNGFGKTIILRMLNGFFNSRYSVFYTIPFSNFKVGFDNQNSIEIIKASNNSDEIDKKQHINCNFYQPDLEPLSFSLKRTNISPEDIDFPIDILDDIVPNLHRIGAKRWKYFLTGETLSFNEIIERFEDIIPFKTKLRKEPKWLEVLKQDIHIRLIESQRLLNVIPRRSIRLDDTPSMVSIVSAYSDELAKLMQNKFAEYGATSQSLDRTYPVRVDKKQPSPDVTDEQLRHQLKELEKTRSRLIDVGLLNKNEGSDFQIPTQTIDDSTKNILSVYIEDVEKKLSVFDEMS